MKSIVLKQLLFIFFMHVISLLGMELDSSHKVFSDCFNVLPYEVQEQIALFAVDDAFRWASLFVCELLETRVVHKDKVIWKSNKDTLHFVQNQSNRIFVMEKDGKVDEYFERGNARILKERSSSKGGLLSYDTLVESIGCSYINRYMFSESAQLSLNKLICMKMNSSFSDSSGQRLEMRWLRPFYHSILIASYKNAKKCYSINSSVVFSPDETQCAVRYNDFADIYMIQSINKRSFYAMGMKDAVRWLIELKKFEQKAFSSVSDKKSVIGIKSRQLLITRARHDAMITKKMGVSI